MIKAIALDLDGTLTNEKKEITPRTRAALEACMERGIHIILASGRPTVGIWPVARDLGLDQKGGYILSYNGGCIIDCRTGQVVAQEVLPAHLIEPICAQAKAAGGVALTYSPEGIVTEVADDPYVLVESRICHIPVQQVENLAQAVQWPVNKMLITRNPEEIVRLEESMQQAFAGQLSVYKSCPYFLEVVPLGVEKAQSLQALLTVLGLTAQELMACGDSWNDLSMIRLAGLGVAMGNAVEDVKQQADYITQDNEHDGVGLAIERWVLQAQP
ncbi:Cof-type HAD-IIB family hydrolase [uncultured Allofournierella sp.]|uniref:Cof-type HAD-IIB family hydrolase n=1 Tax=uncultured Allofournierella sp. TaxID=1940258 RepID=UPI003751D030